MDFCVVESYGTKKLVEKVFYTQTKGEVVVAN